MLMLQQDWRPSSVKQSVNSNVHSRLPMASLLQMMGTWMGRKKGMPLCTGLPVPQCVWTGLLHPPSHPVLHGLLLQRVLTRMLDPPVLRVRGRHIHSLYRVPPLAQVTRASRGAPLRLPEPALTRKMVSVGVGAWTLLLAAHPLVLQGQEEGEARCRQGWKGCIHSCTVLNTHSVWRSRS